MSSRYHRRQLRRRHPHGVPLGPGHTRPPVLATVNYAAGQVIGNTTNVTLCDPEAAAPADHWVSHPGRYRTKHVVIDVQGYFYPATGTCPDDMVAVGSLCVDKYEASLVDASGASTTSAACNVDGSDCATIQMRRPR